MRCRDYLISGQNRHAIKHHHHNRARPSTSEVRPLGSRPRLHHRDMANDKTYHGFRPPIINPIPSNKSPIRIPLFRDFQLQI